MIITTEAYRNLIQINWEARCKEYSKTESQTIQDIHWLPEEWNTKITARLGILATSINDNSPDHVILPDIVTLADYARSWFWIITPNTDDFYKEVDAERERQIIQWAHQVHGRCKWFLIVAEEVGEIAEAIDLGKPDSEIATELIQFSAVLEAWATSRDWFYEPQTPHTTKCQNCGITFETEEAQLIKCPECHRQHDCFGNLIPKDQEYTGGGKTITMYCPNCENILQGEKGNTPQCPKCKINMKELHIEFGKPQLIEPK